MRKATDFFIVIKNLCSKKDIFFSAPLFLETSLIGKALDFGSSEYGFESHVSKLIYNHPYNYLLNNIKLNSAKKKLQFKIRFTVRNLTFLKLLKSLGAIRNFYIIKNNSVFFKIFLYYFKRTSILKNFKIVSTPSRFFFISLKAISLLNNRTGSSIFLLSTPFGIMTHQEAMRFGTGGKVLAVFSI